jgi:D-alanyl-lipoteichoic acid acyltransferase DltB (MBOAT superfamily)
LLFNSYPFLFLFLPVALLGWFVLGRRSTAAGALWGGLCSLFFYGYWDPRYVVLLVASIAFNYGCGYLLTTAAGVRRRAILIAAIAVNLALLAYFKYADFLLATVDSLTHAEVRLLHVTLPLGISFFTFTQIAFLVDAYRGEAREYRFSSYLLFVSYFPHLIAGPILHHREMMPQFDDPASYRPKAANFVAGLCIFALGLAKKVVLADSLAGYTGDVFAAASTPSLFLAWLGVLAYAFQLYFDFSGYSDMAIGLSRLLGVRLPLNFNSPYKACNIIDFWRRWHMTLSRFLRDYLYFALGGNRSGKVRRYVNLLVTMLLGGLWHGAGWTYVVWGGLHGFYLMVNHAWHALRARMGWTGGNGAGRILAILLTFLAVNVAWVFFRSPDFSTAMNILRGMTGSNGAALPAAIVDRIPGLGGLLGQIGVGTFLGGGTRFISGSAWVIAAAIIAFAMPNTQEIMRRARPALPGERVQAPMPRLFGWRPSPAWAIVYGLLFALGLISLSRPSEFLYFQF